MSIFRDPVQTIFDENHSELEERWIALGTASSGALLVVVRLWIATDLPDVTRAHHFRKKGD
jgi:uncharacterized DUF497 family protein